MSVGTKLPLVFSCYENKSVVIRPLNTALFCNIFCEFNSSLHDPVSNESTSKSIHSVEY
jgi:hypothetical protein